MERVTKVGEGAWSDQLLPLDIMSKALRHSWGWAGTLLPNNTGFQPAHSSLNIAGRLYHDRLENKPQNKLT